MVFMISPESRHCALPIQCLPMRGLKNNTVCGMADKIIQAMVEKNMSKNRKQQHGGAQFIVTKLILGFTTDGEFNSLRWKGHSRAGNQECSTVNKSAKGVEIFDENADST